MKFEYPFFVRKIEIRIDGYKVVHLRGMVHPSESMEVQLLFPEDKGNVFNNKVRDKEGIFGKAIFELEERK